MAIECSCESCQASCKFKPGWFKPGEVEKAAKHLGISVQELFDTKLGVDWFVGAQNTFVLAPATTKMDAGEEYPGNPMGRCVFYEDGLCLIHPVKPFECADSIHDEPKDLIKKRHKSIAEAWKPHQKQIVTLLGDDPIAEETSLLESMFWTP